MSLCLKGPKANDDDTPAQSTPPPKENIPPPSTPVVTATSSKIEAPQDGRVQRKSTTALNESRELREEASSSGRDKKAPKFFPARMWNLLVDAVCRPPRDIYEIDDLIGRSEGYFYLGSAKFVREDVVLKNDKGQDLQGSLFRSEKPPKPSTPCVIYCHCNSGSRRDAEEALLTLLPVGVNVFALDFAGSGLSGGQWVTLGHQESRDVGVAVQYLRGRGDIGRLGLWGRSMGAVSALMYASTDPSIACMVLDSPFSDLHRLTHEISKCLGIPLPRPVASLAISFLRRSVKRRAGFDMTEVSPISLVPRSFVPALFCHAKQDDFILPSHSRALYDAYAGDKNYITFDGDHNSCRPHFFYTSVTIFMHNALGAKELMVGLHGAPPVLREPTRRNHPERGRRGEGRGEKGTLHVEPLPQWLEKRVQKRVEKLQAGEGTGAGAGGQSGGAGPSSGDPPGTAPPGRGAGAGAGAAGANSKVSPSESGAKPAAAAPGGVAGNGVGAAEQNGKREGGPAAEGRSNT